MLYSFSWPIEGSLVFGNSRPTAVIPKVWTKHPWWTVKVLQSDLLRLS